MRAPKGRWEFFVSYSKVVNQEKKKARYAIKIKSRTIRAAPIKQYKIVFGKRRSFGYAVSPFCRSFIKDAGSIPTRS